MIPFPSRKNFAVMPSGYYPLSHQQLKVSLEFDDLDVDARQNAFHRALELRPLIAGVGIELDQERESAEEARHQQRAAVAILDVGGMHDRVHQQPLGIDEDVPLLTLDLLARIVARRIDAGPPHMGRFQSSSFICAGRWRVTREAGRSAAEQGAKRP